MTEYWELGTWNVLMAQFIPWTLSSEPVKGRGGQGNYSWIEGAHFQFVRDLNAGNPKVMGNLCWPKNGSIYIIEKTQAKKPQAWKTCTTVKWPRIALGGPNIVKVLEMGSKYARIEGLPYGTDLDPKVINHKLTPWWVHRVYVGKKLRDTPKGIGYMPLYSPVGLRGSGGSALWLDRKALVRRVGEFPDAPPEKPAAFVFVDKGTPIFQYPGGHKSSNVKFSDRYKIRNESQHAGERYFDIGIGWVKA